MNFATFLRLWRSWIRVVVFVLYAALICVALPLLIWQFMEEHTPQHVQAWFVGGIFVMMALPISLWGILQHVINYTTPHLQKYIIRILWMVPIYALNAWFALRFPAIAIYLDTLRECYEAYVIYNFMAFLLSFLNHEYPHLAIQIENKPPVNWVFPLCFLAPIEKTEKFVNRCKHGVLQYTVVRPAMTIVSLVCEMFNRYNEGDFDFVTAWTYVVIINNISQILAMYSLVLFYQGFKEELRHLKPVPKFLCVKAVVFMSFWQALVIAALAKAGVIPQEGPWIYYDDINQVSTGIQDFCICLEMFLAALAHYFSFSHKPYINLAAEQRDCCTSFLLMWDVSDVREDVVEHARYIGRGMQKTISRGSRLGGSRSNDGDENTPLLTESTSSAQTQEPPAVEFYEHDHFQHLQSLKNPSPWVVLEESGEDDSYSAGGDSSRSSNRYGSLATKSTTSSMNNFADFGASTEEGEAARSGAVGKGSRRSRRNNDGFEKSMDGAVIQGERQDGYEEENNDCGAFGGEVGASSSIMSSSGQSHENNIQASASSSSRPRRQGDDVFEELDAAELSDGEGDERERQQAKPESANARNGAGEALEDAGGAGPDHVEEVVVDVHNTDNAEVV